MAEMSAGISSSLLCDVKRQGTWGTLQTCWGKLKKIWLYQYWVSETMFP